MCILAPLQVMDMKWLCNNKNNSNLHLDINHGWKKKVPHYERTEINLSQNFSLSSHENLMKKFKKQFKFSQATHLKSEVKYLLFLHFWGQAFLPPLHHHCLPLNLTLLQQQHSFSVLQAVLLIELRKMCMI